MLLLFMVQKPQNNPVNNNENLFFNILIQRLSVAYFFSLFYQKNSIFILPTVKSGRGTVLPLNTFLMILTNF